jgi:hypothetical protein
MNSKLTTEEIMGAAMRMGEDNVLMNRYLHIKAIELPKG